MKRFYLLLISFLTLSLLVIAQVKMYVYQNNGNIVEVLASRVDSISFLFPDFPVNPDKPNDPVTPEDPDKPDTPVNPEDPDKPDTPVNPEKPEEPEEIEGMVKISAIRNRLEINTNDFTDFAGLYVKSFPSTEDATITYLWKYSADNNTWEDYSFGDGSTWDNIRPNKAGYYRCVLYYETSSNTLAFTSNTLQITSESGQHISYSSKLPVILVRTSEDFPLYGSAEEMKAKRSVDVKILWNQNGGVVTDADVNKDDILYYDKKARMNYRGSSSLDNPKKSYAFVTGDKNCDPKKLGEVKTKKQEMFGSAANKDWVLYASYIDQTYMRNVLSYHQYSKMTGLWGPKCNYVELYVDGSYQGIYVFMDKITQDEKRVNISEDTGYILKFDKTDISDRNKTFITSHTGRLNVQNRDHAFEVDFPEDDDPAWQEKLSAIKNKVNELESSILNNDYEKLATIIDYETWADWFIINEFTKNVDAYRISCYFSLNSINEKIKATPIWDYELGFGNPRPFNADLNTRTLMVEDQSYYADAFPTPFWWVGKGANCKGILGDCKFRELVKERWVKHIGENGALNATVLNNKIDSLSRVLSNSSERTFVDVYELKSWISARTQGLNDIISSWETCTSVPEPTLYTIYFNANGGNGSMNSIELEEGKNFTIPSNPFTRTDYEFVGWNTKADGSGVSYAEGENLTLTTDLTLYAQWKEILNTILYFVNSDEWSNVNAYVWIDETSKEYIEWPGEQATKENISIFGYNIYSYDMSDKELYNMIIFNEKSSSLTPEQTKDLKIDYSKPYYFNGIWYKSLDDMVLYTLSFNANGGSGTMSSIDINAGLSYKLPSSTFSRSGYVFVGWNTKANGTGTSYSAGESIILTADLTLYAQWEKLVNSKLYFVNSDNWSGVNVYVWIDETSNEYIEWPGEEATRENITKYGYNIYSYNMYGKEQYNMIIFNDGSYSLKPGQTDDLIIDFSKPYFYKGIWYKSLDDIVDTETDTANGHDYVDLGLPSGTKWATCNVGADSPEEYGDYFAWGETTTKSTYDWSTYKWCNGSSSTHTKYCTSSSYGTVDNNIVLDLEDDAAYVNWGSSWRMPTKAEQDELRNTSYTTWSWTTQNGVKGYKVTSKTNGNSIFLPAAGDRSNSDLNNAGSYGYYWNSSLDTSNSSSACYLYFNSDYVHSNASSNRHFGQSVRPVLRE